MERIDTPLDTFVAWCWLAVLVASIFPVPVLVGRLFVAHFGPRLSSPTARAAGWWVGALVPLVVARLCERMLLPAIWRLNGSGPGDAEGRGFSAIYIILYPALSVTAMCGLIAVAFGLVALIRHRDAKWATVVTASGAIAVAAVWPWFFRLGASLTS